MTQEMKEPGAQEGKKEANALEAYSPDGEDEFDEEIEGEAKEPNVPISELRKVRAEAARYRKQLRQLESRIEKEQKATELAKLEETDRLKAIAAEAEAKARAIKKRIDLVSKQAAIINAASMLGFYNPKDAASIINLDHLEVDDDGNVEEEKVSELVKSLAESRPYLIKIQQENQDMADFGPTNPASDNWPKPKFRTKDQIDRLKQQSNEALRSGKVAAAVRLYNQAWEMERGIKKPKGG